MEKEKTDSQYALDIISGSNDRDKERLVKIIIALIITIVLIVGGFLLYLNQYDFTALAMEGYGSPSAGAATAWGAIPVSITATA